MVTSKGIESDLLASEEIQLLLKESDELVRIVNTIIANTRKH